MSSARADQPIRIRVKQPSGNEDEQEEQQTPRSDRRQRREIRCARWEQSHQPSGSGAEGAAAHDRRNHRPAAAEDRAIGQSAAGCGQACCRVRHPHLSGATPGGDDHRAVDARRAASTSATRTAVAGAFRVEPVVCRRTSSRSVPSRFAVSAPGPTTGIRIRRTAPRRSSALQPGSTGISARPGARQGDRCDQRPRRVRLRRRAGVHARARRGAPSTGPSHSTPTARSSTHPTSTTRYLRGRPTRSRSRSPKPPRIMRISTVRHTR